LSDYPKLLLDLQQGKAILNPSNNYTPRQLMTTGIIIQASAKNALQEAFESRKIKAIGNQIQPVFIQNPYLKAINIFILRVLFALSPSTFSNNLEHLYAFDQFVPTDPIKSAPISASPSQDLANQAQR